MQFDLKSFIKTILIFVVLSVVWTYFSFTTGRFDYAGDGMLTGFGYLFIFASSFYFSRKFVFIGKWFVLILCTVLFFLFSSFILGPLIASAGYSVGRWFDVLYPLGNSILVAWIFTALLNWMYGIQNRKRTIIITSLCALAAYGMLFLLKEYKYDIPDYWNDIHGLFNVFNLFLLLPLAAGLSLRKKEQLAIS